MELPLQQNLKKVIHTQVSLQRNYKCYTINMKLKITKAKEKKVLVTIAKQLFKKGFTTREIGSKVGRSHTWVAEVIKKTN